MILQQDVSALRIAEVGPVAVLAVCDQSIPLVVVAFVFDQFDVVEPVLYVITLYDDFRSIELSRAERFLLGSRS